MAQWLNVNTMFWIYLTPLSLCALVPLGHSFIIFLNHFIHNFTRSGCSYSCTWRNSLSVNRFDYFFNQIILNMLRTFIYKLLASLFNIENYRFKTECGEFNGSFVSNNLDSISAAFRGNAEAPYACSNYVITKKELSGYKIFSFI